jgi:hypothetical protein
MILDNMLELLRDVGHVKSWFGLFRDGVNVSARLVHSLCQTYHRLRDRFGRIRRYSKVMRLKWKLVLVRLDIALILTQDRYFVYTKRSIGLEIVLDKADRTPR